MPAANVSRLRSWLAAMISLSAVLVFADEPALPPTPTHYFNDSAALVDPDVANRLNLRLEAFERESSNQLLVAIFPKVPEGTWLEDYTVKTFKAWKPGTKKDNGAVLFVFVQDHKLRIEVGYGLEGALPDVICASIIANQIKPAFKAGNFALGLEQGIESIIKATTGEYEGTASMATTSSGSSRWWMIFGVLFLLLVIWVNLGDTVFQRTGRLVLWNVFDVLRMLVFASMQGGGGSAGGGGGSFQGGGGRSGGGGASGDW